MDRLIAYCGLDCAQCGAYIATQAGDTAALEAEARGWEQAYGIANVTVKDVTCDGCRDFDGKHRGYFGAHCYDCDIRACGIQRGVDTCADCDEYACEKLQSFLSTVPDAKASLESLRGA